MAINTLFLTGFEHGFVAAAANAGTGLFSNVGSGFTASTTNPRNGSYCAHLVSPANTINRLEKQQNVAAAKGVARFGLKVSSRPSSGTAMVAHGYNSIPARCFSLQVSSAGVLSMTNVTAGTTQTGPTIDTTSWHLIELQIDVVAGTIDWKVDSVLQTRVTGAAMGTVLGWVSLGTDVNTQPAFTADFDDWITGAWTNAAPDWYGDGKVLAQLPGSDTGHSAVTAFSFGDAGTALSGTPTTAYTMVDDPPGTGGWTATRSTTDNLAMRVVNNLASLGIYPVPTAETGQANAVRAIMSYSSSATQANQAACQTRNSIASGGAYTTLWGILNGVGAAFNVTANNFKGAIVTPPAGGWTAAEVNLVEIRFGGCTSGDISPVPTVQAMMLEVDWSLVPPLVPDSEVSIDTFDRADGLIDAGAGSAIWTRLQYDGSAGPSDLRTISNRLGKVAASPTYQSAYTKVEFDNSTGNFDVVIDCAVLPQPPNFEFTLFPAYTFVTGLPTNFDCFGVIWANGTWILRAYLSGSNAGNLATAPGTLAVGDSIWFRKRGSDLRVYKKPSGGSYSLILSASDTTSINPVKCFVAVELSDTTQRWDNLRGGPLIPTGPQTFARTASDSWTVSDSAGVVFTPVPIPLYENLIDDFNRTDGAIYAGAGASIWNTTHPAGAASNSTVVGNLLAPNLSGGWTKVTAPNDVDLIGDVAARSGSGIVRLFIGLVDGGTSTYDGYNLDLTTGATDTWRLWRIVNGTSTFITSSLTNQPQIPVGGSIWLARRGNKLTVYKRDRPSDGWTQMLTVTDANLTSGGAFGFSASTGSDLWRWDNLRGGPLLVPTSYPRAAADSWSVSDSVVAVQQFNLVRTASDVWTTTDSAVSIKRVAKAATDSWVLSDVAVRAPVARPRTAVDIVALADVAARAPVSRVRTATDVVTFSDAADAVFTAGTVSLVRTATDFWTLSDTVTSAGARARTAADFVGVSDTAVRAPGVRVRPTTDIVTVTDSAARAPASRVRAASDIVLVLDSAVRAAAALVRLAVDIVVVTDVAVRAVAARVRAATDAWSIADVANVVKTGGVLVTAADVVVILDSALRRLAVTLAAFDTLLVSDAAQRGQAFLRTASDSFLVYDSIGVIAGVAPVRMTMME